MSASVGSVRVAMLGCGTVGSEVARTLLDPTCADALRDAVGAPLELVGIAVARSGVPREGIGGGLLTTDATSLVRDGGADVVVELVGNLPGVDALLRLAFDAGASVVTANKSLLSAHLRELSLAASAKGVDMLYEAAVCGAIPIVRVLRTSLAGQRLQRMLGIVNGTTNFLLTTMSRDGRSYEDVLAEATALGYAERDPTADVEGHDAAQKAAILASLAFGAEVSEADVPREGISRLTATDLEAAARMGYVVRLLAVAERVGADGVTVRVHPTMLPKAHPLAAVEGAANAVFIEGDALGPLMLQGRGAGGAPTSTAVLGDLVAAARNRLAHTTEVAPTFASNVHLLAPGDVRSAFYLAIEVADRPGVLAAVARVFGGHGVSIRSMEQVGLGDDARLVFLTHRAATSDMAATVEELDSLDAVTAVGALLHVVEESDT